MQFVLKESGVLPLRYAALPRWGGSGCAPRHGAGKPVRRLSASKRRTGGRAWLRGAARRLLEGATRRALCGAIAARHGGQRSRVTGTRAAASRPGTLHRHRRLLTGRNEASAEDGIDWVRALCVELNVPALRAWGIAKADLPGVVEKAARASSMQANPLPLTGEELLPVAKAAW